MDRKPDSPQRMAHRLPPAGVKSADSDSFRFYQVHASSHTAMEDNQCPKLVTSCSEPTADDLVVSGDKAPSRSEQCVKFDCVQKSPNCILCKPKPTSQHQSSQCSDSRPRPPLTNPGLLCSGNAKGHRMSNEYGHHRSAASSDSQNVSIKPKRVFADPNCSRRLIVEF